MVIVSINFIQNYKKKKYEIPIKNIENYALVSGKETNKLQKRINEIVRSFKTSKEELAPLYTEFLTSIFFFYRTVSPAEVMKHMHNDGSFKT